MNDKDPSDGASPSDAGAADTKMPEGLAQVDMKDNDTLHWVFWPSLLYPGKQYMIGWPMRLAPRVFPGE